MRRAFLLMIALLSLICSCSRRDHADVKPRASDDQSQAIKPDDQEIKAATPEDPGPTAKVVIPLEVLKKQAKPVQTGPEEDSAQELLPIDRPVHLEPQESKHFLHKVFSVSNHAQFIFFVPPRQGNTMLRGSFRSFTKRNDPDSTSDRTAAVDLLLLNDQEFNEFLHGRPQTVTYELDSANNQKVDWRVPTTYTESQTYHLVFSNPDGGTKARFVEADFTVSFE
jgi:hypothetical protein